MDKREIYKTFKYEGREFRIGKFNAMTGSYVAYKLMGQMLPMGIIVDGIKAPEGSQIMSKSDFIDLQKDCLKTCSELLPAGPAEVMYENDTFGIDDIENNAKLALALTVQALVWNISDFFDENLLRSLATGISDIPQSVVKM
jgi:hypothetical protein